MTGWTQKFNRWNSQAGLILALRAPCTVETHSDLTVASHSVYRVSAASLQGDWSPAVVDADLKNIPKYADNFCLFLAYQAIHHLRVSAIKHELFLSFFGIWRNLDW